MLVASHVFPAGLYLPNLHELDDEQAEEILADMMFNDNDLSEYASISQKVSSMFVARCDKDSNYICSIIRLS